MHRKINIEEIEEKIFDIAIIGGGITGAGILYEGGRAGYNCILLEKNDFASGTSSRSAKLVHGGLRYLKYGKLGLVREGLKERHYLLQLFPHLVKPLQFLLPVYGSKFTYSVGMWLYKQFSRDKELSGYRYLDKEETIDYFPAINSEKLRGSFIYYDAVTNDARLTNEVIHLSNELYHTAALNYCEFLSASDRDIHFKILCDDHIENRRITVTSKYIINAAGPWADDILNRLRTGHSAYSAPAKGAHLVFSGKKIPLKSAVVFSSYSGDGRMLYAVPWENNSVIVGATDTEYHDSPDRVSADRMDASYILGALHRFIPSLNISESDILSSFAGIRPLLKEEKKSKDRTRDYRCWWSHKRIINILGGKMTSFHAMAKTVIKKISGKFPPPQKPVSRIFTEEKDLRGLKHLPGKMSGEITKKYGKEAQKILGIASQNQAFSQYLSDDLEIYTAEIIYFIRFLGCFHLDDVLSRRLSLSYVIKDLKNKERLVSSVAGIMKKELEWTEAETEKEIDNYWIKYHSAFRTVFPSLNTFFYETRNKR